MTNTPARATGTGQMLYQRAKQIIPGGTQLLSKRPEMFLPEQWPAYYARAAGAHLWDLDAHQYLDMTSAGIGSTVLGYADADVNAAVIAAIQAGQMTSLNCPEEVELAELLLELHPWAARVRFGRPGGEAMAIAMRLARAATGRDKVAFCGYHGWHDWYLAANLSADHALDGHLLSGLEPTGVPRGLTGSMLPFTYGNIAEFDAIIAAHGHDLAAIVMEPIHGRLPPPGFLEHIRATATRIGAVLVFDEITSGFRLNCGGGHLTVNVNPDVVVLAKAIANGFPMAAIVGIAPVLEAAQRTFISSTMWTERIGPVAALATIHKHRRLKVHEHLAVIGTAVQHGLQTEAARHGLKLVITGVPALTYLRWDYPNALAIKTLYTQEMLGENILVGGAFYPMLAHQQVHVDQLLAAAARVFPRLAAAVATGTVEQQLHGPVCHAHFKRLN